MKSEELQIDILKRQNKEMAIKMQIYRTENQQLKTKNQQLNLWVGNLSEVFSTVSASWESITILQETLLNLMKKRSDMKDKALLRKYQNHFKTFSEIINNLSEKIKNTGHSDQATSEAKEQLRSFVKNYQLIFKQFVQTYFKYNQQFGQFLTNLINRQDAKDNMNVRNIVNKGLQNIHKIKEFESFIDGLKDLFPKFEQYNNQKLLEGVVQKKQNEVKSLTQKVQLLERRIKVMFDYNKASIDMQMDCKQQDFQCKCGGAQLAYMKSTWEEKLKNFAQNSTNKGTQQGKNGVKNQSNQALQAKLAVIEQQKQNLIIRNSLLVQKISKMNLQYKITDQIVLRSSVYMTLKEQCQYLMDYVTQLINKVKKQQDFIMLIEKARDEQIREVKRRCQKSKTIDQKTTSNHTNNFVNSSELFKTQAISLIKNLTLAFTQLNKKFIKNEDHLNSFKQTFQQLRKSNQELNKKINQYQQKQLSKTESIEFKYQKFKQIESNVQKIVQKDLPDMQQLWKQFVVYVKSRDKKIKDLQSTLRKKDRQLAQKIQIQSTMRQALTQTQKIYLQNKQQLDKTTQFIKKMEEQLLKLSQQNFQSKNQLQQDKYLLNLRLKAEIQARNKLEQKLLLTNKIEGQFVQLKQNQDRAQKDYQIWIQGQKKTVQQCKKQIAEKEIIMKNALEEGNEKEKQLQKLQVQKQNLKSQIRQLKNRVDSLMTTTENQVLKMQLNEYKGKIMCSCTGDREREVVLKTCPHLFCKRCIEDTTNNRNRKCPLCGIRFTKTDVHEIKWN